MTRMRISIVAGIGVTVGTMAWGQSPSPTTPELEAVFHHTRVNPAIIKVVSPEAASVRLVEAHNHLNANITAETLIAAMDRAAVDAMVLMPRHYRSARSGGRSSDEQALAYAQRFPGRFIALVGGQRDDLGPRSPVWRERARADQLLAEFDRKLASGHYRGIGEFILVHHAYALENGEAGGEIRIRIDSDFMRRTAALAAKYRVPLVFHAEAEPQPAKEAEALIATSSNTTFIWAHNCGRASAEDITRRFRRFPNLMCDLGHMFNGPRTFAGYGKGWPRKTAWIHLVQDDEGRVSPEMKALFEAFPDRFMIGTDTAHTAMLRYFNYRIAIFRIMLAQLAPDVVRMIGSENARRVFMKTK